MKAKAAAPNRDLSTLNSLRVKEDRALAKIHAREQQVITNFQADPSVERFGDALNEVVGVVLKEISTRDSFDAAIARAGAGVPPPRPQNLPPRPAPGGSPAPAGANNGSPFKPGPGTLRGADTSHWQSNSTFERSIRGTQWTAIKATEGTGYTDPSFRARWNELGAKVAQGKMTLRVGYHFLQPGNGAAQAKHFLSTLGIHGKLPAGTRLALDWEASALSSPKTLKDAANYIHQVTGMWPMVYCSDSRVAQARAAVPNAPMWDAKWSGTAPRSMPFQQISGHGYDHDVFNGNIEALRRFAGFEP